MPLVRAGVSGPPWGRARENRKFIQAPSPEIGLKRFLTVRRSWRGSGVACFWATSFGKNLSAAAARHHLVSFSTRSWNIARWLRNTMHDIVEGLEVRGLMFHRRKFHDARRRSELNRLPIGFGPSAWPNSPLREIKGLRSASARGSTGPDSEQFRICLNDLPATLWQAARAAAWLRELLSKALGLTVPLIMQMTADQVIE